MQVDSVIVLVYFLVVFIAGYFVSRYYKTSTAGEFITGGHDRNWYQIAFALFAMAADPAILSLCGLGFLWGFYIIQWNSVHMWFTTWFAAMFIVPIYWRSKVVTTPEYLEKRFNLPCRIIFSLMLISVLIITLAGAVYLGALLLMNFLGWSLPASVLLISIVIGFYVILGGMKTVLTMDFYQGIFVIVTLLVVLVTVVAKVGGLEVLAKSTILSEAGVKIGTIIPASDWSLTTEKFFPWQAIVTWAPITGLAWLACNFGMAQRLLAAKSEQDAQKGLLFVAILAVFYPLVSFLVGCMMRITMPNILPDEAFMVAILTMVPEGLRGVLIAGLMAALLSTVDGMLTASSALFTEDFYSRILRKGAPPNELRTVVRVVEVLTILLTLALIPVIRDAKSVMTFIQSFYGDVLGVAMALYLVGLFTRRIAPWSGFIAMVGSLILAIALDNFTQISFAYIGVFSFMTTVVGFLVMSSFEKGGNREGDLANLTVYTLSDVQGPWVGLKAWPGLWKWALALGASWFIFSFGWEFLMRYLAHR
jgi:SSS family solute:Na+ symporter